MKVKAETRPTALYEIQGEGNRVCVLFNDLNSIVEIEEGFEWQQFMLELENSQSYIEEHKQDLFIMAKQKEYDVLDTEIKAKRKRLLEETDNYFLSDRPEPTQQMKDYRQKLRDITLQENYPYDVVFPIKP